MELLDIKSRRTWLNAAAIAVALILAVGSVDGLWKRTSKSIGVDFLHYDAVRQTTESCLQEGVYSEEARNTIARILGRKAVEGDATETEAKAIRATLKLDEGVVETIATPFLFSVFNGFSTGNYDKDFARHRAISIACFAFSVLALGKLFGLPWAASLLLLSLFLSWFEPLESDLRVGNINCIQLALVSVSLVLFRQTRRKALAAAAGFLLTVCVMLKPTAWLMLVLPLLFFAAARKHLPLRDLIIGAVTGAAASGLVSIVYFEGFDCWAEWIQILPDVFSSKRVLTDGNIGLVQLLIHVTGISLSALVLLALAVTVAAIGWAEKRRMSVRSSTKDLCEGIYLAIALGGGLMLLSSRLVWTHYYVLAVPLLLLALRGVRFSRRKLAVTIPALLALLSMTVLATATPGLTIAGHAGFLNGGTMLAIVACVTERLLSLAPESGQSIPSTDPC